MIPKTLSEKADYTFTFTPDLGISSSKNIAIQFPSIYGINYYPLYNPFTCEIIKNGQTSGLAVDCKLEYNSWFRSQSILITLKSDFTTSYGEEISLSIKSLFNPAAISAD